MRGADPLLPVAIALLHCLLHQQPYMEVHKTVSFTMKQGRKLPLPLCVFPSFYLEHAKVITVPLLSVLAESLYLSTVRFMTTSFFFSPGATGKEIHRGNLALIELS